MKQYVCNECNSILEKSDLEEGLILGEHIMLFCPSCDKWIIIKYEQDAKKTKNE